MIRFQCLEKKPLCLGTETPTLDPRPLATDLGVKPRVHRGQAQVQRGRAQNMMPRPESSEIGLRTLAPAVKPKL